MNGRPLVWGLLVLAGGVAAWEAFIRIQGDSEVVYGSDELSAVSSGDGSLHGEVALVNQGRQLAAIRRVEGRVVEGPPGRVLVTRKGTRPHERGFWISNLLKPGESCIAEVDVELDEAPRASLARPVVIELDVHEIGRSLLVHRRGRFGLAVPALAGEGGQRDR